ncbi:hypothetical protein BH23GEM6_BH23GEM6_08320 [soil metagenome]
MVEERYEFEGEAVLELLRESRAADERLMTEAQRYLAAGVDIHSLADNHDMDIDHPGTGAPPGVWIMNDRGVYLRSNAADGGSLRVPAVGSEGTAPAGMDTLCEFIAAEPLDQIRPGDTVVVRLSEHKIRLSLIREE